MPDYLQLLNDHGMILGTWDQTKVHVSPQWFWDRRIDLIDFRGDLRFFEPNSITFGFRIKVLTASHDMSAGTVGPMAIKRVWVHGPVFVGSGALLYNCELMPRSVVACGAVVRNMTVQSDTMVEGNPARVVKRYVNGQWQRVERQCDE
jgi:acetyltransferase-like isoleucine patch superfamily enzyme